MPDIYKTLENEKPVVCLFENLSQTFETVCPKHLLQTLNKGLFLGRQQMVEVDGQRSFSERVNA